MGVKVREQPKGSGTWYVFINHKGSRKAKRIGKDKKLASETARKIEAQLILGDLNLSESSNAPTFKQYVIGWTDSDGQIHIGWLEKFAELALKNSSRLSYRNIINKHLMPEFGNKSINQITSRLIGDLIVKKFKQGLRSQTVKNLKNCLGSILRYAHKPDSYLKSNPARGVSVPKPEDEKPSRIPDPFSWEDREILEDIFFNHYPEYYPLILTGFRTGLRVGELIALQWKDVDFIHRLIYVTRNITRNKITTPKSQSSIRKVRMTSQLVDILQDLYQRRKQEKLHRGWKEFPDWLFCNEDGKFLSYDIVYRWWNKGMVKSRLRHRTCHDMRHTYATLRLSKGDSLAEIAKEMGHSKPNITYQTYYKWLPKESRSDIDELDNMTQKNANYPQVKIKKESNETDNVLK
ncbi:MAG: site-specific integrase [bacterium]|nr:MAG: site-specific integrase [bacterium]